ncbi:MAG: hypothetical protein ACREGJ_01170 [Candidatus Saccharimonadales bacterium]
MEQFINSHVIMGFLLIVLAVLAAWFPKKGRTPLQSAIVRLFFAALWLVGLGGLVIGVYRHPTSISVFQVVTVVALAFATIGLLADMGKLDGFRGKSGTFWYINGLGGSLISVASASLFFLSLTYIAEFYQANIIWLTVVYIAVPVFVGREFIKRSLEKENAT